MKHKIKKMQKEIGNRQIKGIYRRELDVLLVSTNLRADRGAIYIEK
jgi:hypothetical protein